MKTAAKMGKKGASDTVLIAIKWALVIIVGLILLYSIIKFQGWSNGVNMGFG